MYFAIQPADPATPARISHDLAALRAQRPDLPLHLCGLVDCAFDEKLPTNRRWSRQPRYSLYEHTSLHALADASPHLFAAPGDVADETVWLQDLFMTCAERPMLSILACSLRVEALRAHLRPFLIAYTPDGLGWPVRWGDTRVLPALMDVLPPDHRKYLLSPFHCWWTSSRDGTLISWPGSACTTVPEPEFDKLPMDDAAFACLVDRAEADAILANIHDTQPDVLRRHHPIECHALVTRHLGIADAYGMTAAGARRHLCVLALCLAADFTSHPTMAETLKRVRDGAEYRTAIADLPADFWRDVSP